MADRIVYVGNRGGDTTSDAPASAAIPTSQSTPYATLLGAITAEKSGGSIDGWALLGASDRLIIRLQSATVETLTAVLDITGTQFSSPTATKYVIVEGYGAGKHTGAWSTGYTVRVNSNTYGAVINASNDYLNLRDFSITHSGADTSAGNEALKNSTALIKMMVIERMVLSGRGRGLDLAGGATTGGHTVKNCIIRSLGSGNAIRMSNYATITHNTLLNNSATLPCVDAGSSTSATLKWNYAHNAGAAAAYGGSGWAAATRAKNASSDTSGDTSYQSIAYSVSAGAYFTSVTAGSEDFSIGASSSLKDAATDSTETVDAISTARPYGTYRDIGAFEYFVSGPQVTDVNTDEALSPGETATITGTGFGATQGAGGVKLTQEAGALESALTGITWGGDTSITGTVALGGLSYGATTSLVVTDDAAATGSIAVTFVPATGYSYVTLSGYPGTGYVIGEDASPAVVDGDQVEYESTASSGAGVTVNADGTFVLSTTAPATFSYRVRDNTDNTWSSWGTIRVNMPNQGGAGINLGIRIGV